MSAAQQHQQAPPSAEAPTADLASLERDELSLSEMSRIMDVASTLRKERALIERELNRDEVQAELRNRLLKAAQISGDPVGEAEIDTAIEHYYDRLHTFQPPRPGLQTLLAHLYVRRTAILGWAIALAAAAAAVGGMFLAGLFPSERRDEMLARTRLAAIQRRAAAIEAIAEPDEAGLEVGELVAGAAQLARQRDLDALEAIDDKLADAYALLDAEYVLSIPSTPDQESAFPMDYTDASGTRRSGYYVIVEARTPTGEPATASIRDRQTGQVVATARWAEQVPEAIYERLRDDKQSDGVLDENIFGNKVRGERNVNVELETAAGEPLERGGQLTQW